MDYSDTTVVIPAKDEKAVAPTVKKVLKALPKCKVIVVYIGDVSRIANRNVLFLKQKGKGYGGAIREGYAAARTEIVADIDADGTYEPMDLRKVVSMVREGADLAIGNRLTSSNRKSMDSYIIIGNTLATMTFNIMHMKWIGDSQSGLWAMKRDMLKDLHFEENGWLFRPELNAEVANKGYKIVDTPIRYYARVGSSKLENKFMYGFNLFAKTVAFRFRS